MTRTSGRVAWGIAALTPLLVAAALVITITLPCTECDQEGEAFFLVPGALGILALSAVGALIAARTGNRIGWVFLGIGGAFGGALASISYADHALPSGGAFGPAALWLSQWLFMTSLALPILVFFLFPTGTPPAGRWRWAWRFYVGALVVHAAGWVVLPFVYEGPGPPAVNPLAIEALEPVLAPVLLAAGTALLASVPLSFASLVSRYRRAGIDERQQIRWLAVVGVAAVITFAVGITSGFIAEETGSTVADVVGSVTLVLLVIEVFLGIPVAAAIAILRYRLFDLDIVVKKTVILTLVAGTLTALYLALVALTTLGNVSRLLVAAVLLAVTFSPVRRAARSIADRVAYGKRATPYEVLTSFSGRLGEAYSAEDVLPRMARVLAEGVGAERATVWLRVGGTLRPAASWPGDGPPGDPTPLPEDGVPALGYAGSAFEVRDRGEVLGALAVSMPANDPITPDKERLARDLAGQAGLVLRNAGLIEELRASRQRIVAAQDDERRRLERNIHDGAQQQLVALAVKLRLLEQLARRDPERAAATAAQLQAEATEALEDLRDLARGIYPPLLADRGLVAALEAQARKSTVPVTISPDGLGRYAAEVESAVYFCCLEALQNVAKYAEATRAEVRLAVDDGELAFEVVDDGVGFDPATALGSGLQGMADRLEALGGRLDVGSTLGGGTTVRGRVPLRHSAPATGDA
jgi:signal transduction histidine kinase